MEVKRRFYTADALEQGKGPAPYDTGPLRTTGFRVVGSTKPAAFRSAVYFLYLTAEKSGQIVDLFILHLHTELMTKHDIAHKEFKKKVLTLRQYLAGAGYYNAMIALEFAAKHHTGFRKDGYTPEFDHQISIALFALTLPNLMFREEVIATILLHDVREDYHITDAEIRALFPAGDFTDRVSRAVENMTKEWRGEKKDEVLLFEAMADDPVASIAKLCDRNHNYQSMIRVFGLEKQKDYLDEGVRLFLPMLKKAKRNFPRQYLAYENIKHVLTGQMDIIRAMLDHWEAANAGRK
jgi:(p)ppGpp synthase/HD superfamily hydrolase